MATNQQIIQARRRARPRKYIVRSVVARLHSYVSPPGGSRVLCGISGARRIAAFRPRAAGRRPIRPCRVLRSNGDSTVERARERTWSSGERPRRGVGHRQQVGLFLSRATLLQGGDGGIAFRARARGGVLHPLMPCSGCRPRTTTSRRSLLYHRRLRGGAARLTLDAGRPRCTFSGRTGAWDRRLLACLRAGRLLAGAPARARCGRCLGRPTAGPTVSCALRRLAESSAGRRRPAVPDPQ